MNSLTDSKVEDFFSHYTTHKAKKDEILIYADESPRGVIFLQKGYVKEYGISVQGIETTFHIFTRGSFFPLTWALSNINNRHYYESLSAVEYSQAPKEDVVKFIQSNPDVLFDLTNRLLNGIDKLTTRIEHLTYDRATLKIISILLFLARHFGIQKSNTLVIQHKFTHRDIGSLAGVTRETTSRELEKLEKEGYITYLENYISIPNISRLEKEVSAQ